MNDMTKGTFEIFEIRLAGHLTSGWVDWFAGMEIRLTPAGETVLTGPVADQAALYGLLKKVRDLGLPLRAVNPLSRENASGWQENNACKENMP